MTIENPDTDELVQYNYELPKHLIAQEPAHHRSDARLMIVDRSSRSIVHQHVRDLPQLLRINDCLVVNDTRVVPARLVGMRATQGRWEGLYMSTEPSGAWQILCKARGKLLPGETIQLLDRQAREDIQLRLVAKSDDGIWLVRPSSDEPANEILERIGRVPLPKYIRHGEMVDDDRGRYQTVFARHNGSSAAPTAGLHFSTELIAQLKTAGIPLVPVTLHVGLDTFRPIKATQLANHPMHSEMGRIEAGAVDQLLRARQSGGRIIAVGTTTVRVLETAATDGVLRPWEGPTDLFIRPRYRFRAVDALLTNFHLPRTTLLVLVRTFGGDELIRQAYDEAIRQEYRFYSYGDAMLIV